MSQLVLCDMLLQFLWRNMFSDAAPGDEMHFFHVISLPRPRIGGAFVGVGVGGIDELVFSDPDPTEDAKHVCGSPAQWTADADESCRLAHSSCLTSVPPTVGVRMSRGALCL